MRVVEPRPFSFRTSSGATTLLVLAIGLTTACDSDRGAGPVGIEADHVVAGEGVVLAIDDDPYRFRVYDAAGSLVIASKAAGEGDGYGAVGWTTGAVSWHQVASPGYTLPLPSFDPWRDAWVVVEAEPVRDGIDVVIAPRDQLDDVDARRKVSHRLRDFTVRVEVAGAANARAFSAAFESPPDEAFMGFGERFNRIDQRGLTLFSWAEEGGIGQGEGARPGPENPWPHGETMTYYPVPFFLSSRGYGFWLDSTWFNEFELASVRSDAWRVWHLGPQLAFEIYVADREETRPWPYTIIDRFTAETGRPMVPPVWAFGPRRRIGRGSERDGVPEIRAMRDRDLAITGVDDAMHFLPLGKHVGLKSELSAWVASATDLGYRVCAYYNPYLALGDESNIADVRDEAIARGWVLSDADGKPSVGWLISGERVDIVTVDFTHPDAKSWFGSVLGWAVDLGYSGWMQDFGEYVSPDVRTRSGSTGEAYHNRFPVDYHRAVFEHMEAGPRAGDWLAFVRSGYTGSQQWSPMVWSGDPNASFDLADGLPSMIRAGLNLGIGGVPHFGGDIGGFHCIADGYGGADEELLARWIQQGSMTPNMMDQNACNGALDSGRKANVFDDPAAQEAWREYARLHTRLFPYTYSLSHQAHRTGAPIMRQMFLEHPEDPSWTAVDDAYYYGPAILVAPVVRRGEIVRRLHLPAGTYLDWHERRLVYGGTEVELPAPLERLPLLLRDGHLIPLLDASIDTLADEAHPEVVGPADVGDVYDVVGLVSADIGRAAFALFDGTSVVASWSGGDVDSILPFVGEGELADCDGCWRIDALAPALVRVRISSSASEIAAGSLRVENRTGRRIRWDLYLAN